MDKIYNTVMLENRMHSVLLYFIPSLLNTNLEASPFSFRKREAGLQRYLFCF